jgi:MSHA pilin protein MshC
MMRRPKTCARGFTLTELVVVIVIATILAAFAIARIDTRDFDAEGYANQVRAAVRYAQKIAISQRRNVTVTVNASAGVSLAYAAPTSAPVRMPPGTDAFVVSKPAGASLSGTLSGGSFTFSPLGDPGAGGTIIVSAVGGGITPVTITVEGGTGYVH